MIKKEHIKKLREMNTDAEKLVSLFFFFLCLILKWWGLLYLRILKYFMQENLEINVLFKYSYAITISYYTEHMLSALAVQYSSLSQTSLCR